MKKLVLLVLLNFTFFNIYAQVDSTQTTQQTSEDEKEEGDEMPSTEEREALPEWYYSFGADGVYNSGNVNRQLLTLRASINYEKPKSIWGFNTSPKYQYGRNNKILQEREFYADFNNTLFYSQSDVYGLVFGSYEESNLRKINSRFMLGLGVGYKIIGSKNHPNSRIKLGISNAFLKEKTDFYTREDRNIWRNSTRVKLKVELIKDKLFFNNVTFFQPSVTSNYLRWNAFSQIQLKVAKHISFTAALDNSFENINTEGVKNTQINAILGFTYSQSN
ncbi:DUF481 domain-containing protein [Lacihabitans soyangensis]|uniref:DUF481 domain-containing protein n=1 Tax=Lacihabitans soyangensis TaxID=869394 RepID=A0AAE3H5Z7_9BACT|nr:DUF481 domain-containing protein [Lacihabitans soyangensis]MCP9763635.1 DUF481 domain-containing protein [Lacihabitans soyangensis]